MNLMEIEQATRQIWPALEQKALPYGVLRYAQGVSRRSNSLSLFPECEAQREELIASAEIFFRDRQLDSIIRILDRKSKASCDFQALDEMLEAQSYELQAPTKIMVMDVPSTPAHEASCVIEEIQLADWLKTWHEFSGQKSSNFAVHLKMMKNISNSHCFTVLKNEQGEILSCGMAVISGAGVGFSCIATAQQHRGKSYGQLLIKGLLDWGKNRQAAYAFLQVESGNSSAISLYEKLGFRELYSYWYRVKKMNKLMDRQEQ